MRARLVLAPQDGKKQKKKGHLSLVPPARGESSLTLYATVKDVAFKGALHRTDMLQLQAIAGSGSIVLLSFA